VALRNEYATSVLSYILTGATRTSHLQLYMQLHNDIAPISPRMTSVVLLVSNSPLVFKALSFLKQVKSLPEQCSLTLRLSPNLQLARGYCRLFSAGLRGSMEEIEVVSQKLGKKCETTHIVRPGLVHEQQKC